MKPKPITIILLFALLIRLISLNQSLWLDEAIQWWAVTTFPLKELITEYIRGDFNPPLFHILLWFWVKIAGTSEIALRLPSIAFGVGTVYLAYKISQLIFKPKKLAILNLRKTSAEPKRSVDIFNFELAKKSGLASARRSYFQFSISEAVALLVATGPLLIYYSQEARMYALAAFTTTGAIYSVLSYRKSPRPLFAICYLLFAIAMLYSHYLTWLLIPLLLVLSPTLTLLSLVALVPWAPIFWQQLNQGVTTATVNPAWANVVGELSLKNTALIPIKFLLGRISIDNNYIYGEVIVIPLMMTVYLLYKALPRQKNPLVKIIWTWLMLPLVLAAFLALKVPVFSYFRFLFVVPALYLLITQGIATLRPPLARMVFVAALVFNLVATGIYLFNPHFHREDWRQATRYIESYQETNIPVFIHAAVSPPFVYYHATSSQILSETEVLKAQNYPSIWYIPYAQPIFDPQNSLYQTLLNLGFTEVDKRHFRGVTVIRLKNLNYRYLSTLNQNLIVTQ